MINIIFVVLIYAQIIYPKPEISCYSCWGKNCTDPFTGKPEDEVECTVGFDYCVKVETDKCKWLQTNTSIFI
jgi:hypothetical protein